MNCVAVRSLFLSRVLLALVTMTAVSALSPLPAYSQDQEKRSVVVLPETAHEFGSVPQGTIVTHDFEIRNTGTADLQITRIAPGCGCTAATLSSSLIQPGKSEKIRVRFNTSGFSGKKFKQIHVFTSDRDRSDFILTLRGTIVTDVAVEPTKLDFGEVARSSSLGSRQQQFSFTTQKDSEKRIAEVVASSKSLRVQEVSRKGGARVFNVELLSSVPLGELRERVLIRFTDESIPAVNIPVTGRVVGDVRVSPATVSFGVVDGAKELERRVQWHNLSTKPVEILGVSSSDSAVSASVIDIQPGKQGVVALRLDPSRVARDLKATVTLTTDHPDQREVVLAVYGVKPPK